MGLITLGLPADIIQHIKNLIVDQTQSLEGEADSPGKEETIARIAKWQAFIKFVENQDSSFDVEVFPLSVSGSGSTANLMILEAFYTRDSEGSAIVLNDQPTINKLKNALYSSIQENTVREHGDAVPAGRQELNADMSSSGTKGNPGREAVGGRHKSEDSNSSRAYFNVCKPHYFEWWEKDSPNNLLKGVVRINIH